jgi:hypothetical protein
MARVSEKRVGIAVLNILAARPKGEATVQILKAELPNHIALSADDQEGRRHGHAKALGCLRCGGSNSIGLVFRNQDIAQCLSVSGLASRN